MRVMKQFETWLGVAKQSDIFVQEVNLPRILVGVVDQSSVAMGMEKQFGVAVCKREHSGIRLGVM